MTTQNAALKAHQLNMAQNVKNLTTPEAKKWQSHLVCLELIAALKRGK